jgi:hypothetical protein
LYNHPFLSPDPFRWDLLILQVNKTANACLARDLLAAAQEGQRVSGETLDYEDVKHICGALYGGMFGVQ